MLRHLVLTVSLIFSGLALVAAQSIEIYKVKVVTQEGNRYRGVLKDVTDYYLYLDYDEISGRDFISRIPLTHIRKVVIRRNNEKDAALTGAIVGGIAVGYLANKSIRKSPPSGPFLYGVLVTFSAAAGATGGAVVGSAFGKLKSRIVRPFGQTPDQATENLRRQLEPFTYSYQSDVLNRVPQ